MVSGSWFSLSYDSDNRFQGIVNLANYFRSDEAAFRELSMRVAAARMPEESVDEEIEDAVISGIVEATEDVTVEISGE